MLYILIILISLAAIGFLIFSYERKLNLNRRQLIVANSQIDKLKRRVPSTNKTKGGIRAIFSHPNSNMGIISEGSKLFIAPMDSSDVIQNITIKMEVKILDKVEISNNTWYYVALPMDSNINSRGWIKSMNFSCFYNSSSDLVSNLNNK